MDLTARIESLYEQYQEEAQAPSIKQNELITQLGGNPEDNTSVYQAQKHLRFLMGQQPITEKQQALVRSFDKGRVDEVLRRDVIIEEMTRFDMQRVMNVLFHHHRLNPRVYNHPLYSGPDYEYGWQESDKCPNNQLYYIVFYDLLMVDIDGISDLDLAAVEELFQALNLSGRIYRTYNGYHIFVTSRPFSHKDSEAKKLMELLGCDLYYVTFAQINGFKVRLNPKLREDETVAAEYLTTVGTVQEDPRLCELLALHDKYLKQHAQ